MRLSDILQAHLCRHCHHDTFWHPTHIYNTPDILTPYTHIFATTAIRIQPIADRVTQNLQIVSTKFQFSTRRTRILVGFIIYYLVLIVNPMCRILVRWKSFRNNLDMLCHPICNWLYLLTPYTHIVNPPDIRTPYAHIVPVTTIIISSDTLHTYRTHQTF